MLPRRVKIALLLVALVPAIVGAAGETELIAALRAGDAATVRALLKSGVNVNAAQGDGATPLHWAVRRAALAPTDLLRRAGGGVTTADDPGAPRLSPDCINRHSALVDRLLAAGANPNLSLVNGETPLMMCSRAGDPA